MSEETSLILYGISAFTGTIGYLILSVLTFKDLIETIRYPLEYVERQRPLLIAAWRNFLFALILMVPFVAYDAIVVINLAFHDREFVVQLNRTILVAAIWVEVLGVVLLLVGRRLLNEDKERAQQDGDRDSQS